MSRREMEEEPDAASASKRSRQQPSALPLDFTTPQSLFNSFIAPVTSEEFFSAYWEKKPLLIQQNSPEVRSYFQSLFTMKDLKHASNKGMCYGRDVNMCKCKDGKKVLLHRRGKAGYLEILKDFRRSKATVQFHQPQRFNDKLWHIMEKLECFFGTLVGCNVYITPSDSQGLPPHHDDVEVFIIQVEGEKHWRLYEPITPLAREYAVAPADKVTTPTHDIVLKEGDMLYFPRGVIHQADTYANSSHSTHVTISTYQNTSWADYLQDVLPPLLNDVALHDVELRKGIPLQQLLLDASSAAKSLTDHLSNVIRRIQGLCPLRSSEMVRDFMVHRLPPCADEEKEDGNVKSNNPPNINSTIRLQYKDYATIAVDRVPKMLNPKEEVMVYVFHALKNDRKAHMVSDNEESPSVNGLRFPMSHINAVKLIWENNPVRVADLPLDSDQDKQNLVLSLWTEGLVQNILTEP